MTISNSIKDFLRDKRAREERDHEARTRDYVKALKRVGSRPGDGGAQLAKELLAAGEALGHDAEVVALHTELVEEMLRLRARYDEAGEIKRQMDQIEKERIEAIKAAEEAVARFDDARARQIHAENELVAVRLEAGKLAQIVRHVPWLAEVAGKLDESEYSISAGECLPPHLSPHRAKMGLPTLS